MNATEPQVTPPMCYPDDPELSRYQAHARARFRSIVLGVLFLLGAAFALAFLAPRGEAQEPAQAAAVAAPLAPPSIALTLEDGRVIARELETGWTYLEGPLGVHLFNHLARITAGVANGDGAGLVHWRSIELTFPGAVWTPPRLGFSQPKPNVIRIGGGDECFSPGRALRVPILDAPNAWPAQLTDEFAVSSTFSIKLPESMRGKWLPDYQGALLSGARAEYLRPATCGVWRFIGADVPNEGGLKMVEPISGWEQHAPTLLLRAWLAADAAPLDYLDKVTGEPLAKAAPADPRQTDYFLNRGPFRNAKHGGLWKAANTSPPWESNAAVPVTWNAGSCSYAAALCSFDNDAPDGQHLIRLTAPLEAAAQLFGDECAAFDLRVLEADCGYGSMYVKQPEALARAGSGWFGRREPAWVAWSTHVLGGEIAKRTARAQMTNGGFMRVGIAQDDFIPSPWRPSPPIVMVPLPSTSQIEPSMERWLTVHALVRHGYERNAIEACAREFLDLTSVSRRTGAVPKFFEVAIDASPGENGSTALSVLRRVRNGTGGSDFAVPLATGVMACLEQARGDDGGKWLHAQSQLSLPTKGRPVSIPDMGVRLRDEYGGRSQIVALSAALEHWERN